MLKITRSSGNLNVLKADKQNESIKMKLKEICRVILGKTIYFKIPVYNMIWLRRSDFYRKILKDRSITVVDVGARNTSLEELLPLQRHIEYIGFDADEQEVNRLNGESSIFKSSKFIPAYVGSKNKEVNFALHYDGGNSSIYPFSESYLKWFRNGDSDYVKEYHQLFSRSLDDLVDADVDLIKVDTQGTEYDILNNATNCLTKALMVEVEVEFIQMYEGQKLAHDVLKLMHDRGFELLFINRVFAQSSKYIGLARGQITFGDVLFGLSRDKALHLPLAQQVKYIALLINYGHIDFAYDLYSNNSYLRDELPFLSRYFLTQNRQSFFGKGLRFILDKILFLLLVARSTNGLTHDSDRSWPIR